MSKASNAIIDDQFYDAYISGKVIYRKDKNGSEEMTRNQLLLLMTGKHRDELFAAAFLDLENAITAKMKKDAGLAIKAQQILKEARDLKPAFWADSCQHGLLTILQGVSMILKTQPLTSESKINPAYTKAAAQCADGAKSLSLEGIKTGLFGALDLFLTAVLGAVIGLGCAALQYLGYPPILLFPFAALDLAFGVAAISMFPSSYKQCQLGRHVRMFKEAALKSTGTKSEAQEQDCAKVVATKEAVALTC